MSKVDTNKVSRRLYKSIFDRVDFDTSAKCLLLKLYFNSVISEEYGLYDYKTHKYFYTSIETNGLYHFNGNSTPKSQKIYDRMKEFLDNPKKASSYVGRKTQLFDGGSFELSYISVNVNHEIIVKSYYW